MVQATKVPHWPTGRNVATLFTRPAEVLGAFRHGLPQFHVAFPSDTQTTFMTV